MTGYLLLEGVSRLAVEALVAVVASGLQFPADGALLPGAVVSGFDVSVAVSPGCTLRTAQLPDRSVRGGKPSNSLLSILFRSGKL